MEKKSIASIVIPLLVIVTIHSTYSSEANHISDKVITKQNQIIEALKLEAAASELVSKQQIIDLENKIESLKKDILSKDNSVGQLTKEKEELQTTLSQVRNEKNDLELGFSIEENQALTAKHKKNELLVYSSSLGIAAATDYLLSQTLSSNSKFKPLHHAVQDSKNLQLLSLFVAAWDIPVPSYFHERHTGINESYKAHFTGVVNFTGEAANALFLQYLKKQWDEKKKNSTLIRKLDHELQKLPSPIKYFGYLLTIRGFYILEKRTINSLLEK